MALLVALLADCGTARPAHTSGRCTRSSALPCPLASVTICSSTCRYEVLLTKQKRIKFELLYVKRALARYDETEK